MRFASDGRTLAWADERHIAFWDLAAGRSTGDALAAPPADRIAFSPDAKTLAAAGDNGVTLWDLESGLLIGRPLSIRSDPGGTRVLAFDAAGDAVVVASESSTGSPGTTRIEVLRWDLRSESWMRMACRVANRHLTAAEWRRYVGSRPYRPACRTTAR